MALIFGINFSLFRSQVTSQWRRTSEFVSQQQTQLESLNSSVTKEKARMVRKCNWLVMEGIYGICIIIVSVHCHERSPGLSLHCHTEPEHSHKGNVLSFHIMCTSLMMHIHNIINNIIAITWVHTEQCVQSASESMGETASGTQFTTGKGPYAQYNFLIH